MASGSKSSIVCHYEVLGIDQNADFETIKKSHRKLALKLHPDKNLNDETTAEKFRIVQQAYECLSDPAERKWYDKHRDAILKGWSAASGSDNVDIVFDVVPFMYAGCYKGYSDKDGDFFDVYGTAFQQILDGELAAVVEAENDHVFVSSLPRDFGTLRSSWGDVSAFYQSWESFTSSLSFAWADPYGPFDVKEAPSRWVRRKMEEENKKARKAAKRERNEDILALVSFVKKRDPRVKARKEQIEREKAAKEKQKKEEASRKKEEARELRDQWRQEAEDAMAEAEQMDRLAGRVRLADLEDDYDYGGSKKGKKKKGKQKGGKEKEGSYNEKCGKKRDTDDEVENLGSNLETTLKVDGEIDNHAPLDGDQGIDSECEGIEHFIKEDDLDKLRGESESDIDSESESEDEPDFWRCECCRKDFQSEAQMQNHMRSKKHKEAYKKYEMRLAKLGQELFDEL